MGRKQVAASCKSEKPPPFLSVICSMLGVEFAQAQTPEAKLRSSFATIPRKHEGQPLLLSLGRNANPLCTSGT
jgi:hypothetical protein